MKRLLTFCFLPFLISCQNNDLDLKSNPIDSKIIIEAREVLEANSRRLTLFSKTERIYPCENYPLLAKKEVEGNSLKITFTSVLETDFCFTALGPATSVIDLDEISNGEYEIEINNANLKNKGILKITDLDISILFNQKNGIEFVRQNIKRVSENTYWGSIGYHQSSTSALVEEFIQKFEEAGAKFNKQLPGHYSYYEIDNSGEIVSTVENSGYYFLKNFIFEFEGDESNLKEIVQIEGKNHKEIFHLRLETYKGEMFYNWGN